ncbi:class I adenylate-forming enzyme family protein [Rubripirellula reticaptiva]|uniref:Long-chain-fatty-acid--CoA ligase n=1 Tax=Rubripirellula reticaptiva TaxID=2528013 RepID=A0A5C6F6F4_9BACT|nr:AMP-binding protein [Rubripirellula reticaptiva]TWU56150.1 Long-chain-fatty-acid--CoA ligase [Rubripirellula reticaptiva]
MPYRRLIDAFDFHVADRGDAVALIARSRSSGQLITSTWKQLDRLIHERSAFFANRHFGHAHPDNSHEQVVDILAMMRYGVMEACVDPELISVDEMQTASPEAALVLQTSGTTSTPKGVVLTHTNLLGNAAAKLTAVPQSTDDVRLTVLPLSHAYARTSDFGTWMISGCKLAVTLGFDGLRDFAPIVHPTLMNVVPSIAYQLLDSDTDLAAMGLGRLRLLGCGGAPISAVTFDLFKRLGITVIQGYGLTETGPVICSATPENATAGLVGDFVDGWQHEIRSGELYVRGPHVMQGYWNDETATRAKIDSGGWLRTGDLVERDEETGQLRILGRVDDVLVMDNGRKISPNSIQRDLEQVAGVNHAMLVWRGRLECWIDGDMNEDSIRKTLSQYPHCRHATLHRFDPPLSAEHAELTAKGTIRRNAIMARWNSE